MAELDLNDVRRHAHAATPPGRDIGPDLAASRARARRRPRWRGPLRRFPRFFAVATALIGVLLVAVLAISVWGFRLTTNPQPNNPDRVDALLVLYSSPAVYWAALDLVEQGVTDTVFVSAYMGPDDHEQFCGEEAKANPALQDVQIECFWPDPITTQGEALYASQRMEELGLRSLGVVTFPEHLERARLVTERCWTGPGRTVSMYDFDPGYSTRRHIEQVIYGSVAFVPVAVVQSCDGQLPEWIRWSIEQGKEFRWQAERWVRERLG
ncbi:MAG: hypothetical protein Q4G34_05635 [Micrococcus sp.]|nr:hypothetical protein [Micrococcus sp.]